MRRRLPLFLLLLCSFFTLTVFAQPQATESKVKHTKGNKVAAVIEIPYSEEVVEASVKDYMALKGVKGDKAKGFTVFRNVKLEKGDNDLHDLHFKIESKSRKESNISLVYLLVGRPGENVGVRTSDDRHKIAEAKDFLNTMLPAVDSYDLEVKIKDQEDFVKKNDKKLAGFLSEQQDLEKKIADLQKKLEENKINQQKQTEESDKQKTVLDAMKARRKS